MMWGWGQMFGFGGFFMMFMMVIFWALIIVGIIFAVRIFSGATMVGAGGAGKARAIEILKERYARGEISTEEYESKKRELES